MGCFARRAFWVSGLPFRAGRRVFLWAASHGRRGVDLYARACVWTWTGDDPPRDRTGELRALGFPGRHLGSVQMTTDTALGVTKRVVVDKGASLAFCFVFFSFKILEWPFYLGFNSVLGSETYSAARGDPIRRTSFVRDTHMGMKLLTYDGLDFVNAAGPPDDRV